MTITVFDGPLRTRRLRLRPPRSGDGAEMAAAMGESYDAVFPWFSGGMGSKATECDPAWQEIVAGRFSDQFADGSRYPFLAFDGQTLVAFAELTPMARRRLLRLSFWTRARFQRQGIATEAGAAVLRFGFERLHARAVFASRDRGNLASAATLARLGFEPQPLCSPTGRIVRHRLTDPGRLPPRT